MHRHEIKEHASPRPLSHLNYLFTGSGTRLYDVVMVPLTRRLYQRVIADLAPVLSEGQVLDVGTGPGTLARDMARRLPGLQVFGIDLSADMIRLARAHAQREHIEERVRFEVGNVAHLPFPDHAFDLIVSTISLHHWEVLEQPFRELYRVLRPGGQVWVYDFRFVKVQTVKQALANTSFVETELRRTLVRTDLWPFALYQRFALHKPSSSDHQHD